MRIVEKSPTSVIGDEREVEELHEAAEEVGRVVSRKCVKRRKNSTRDVSESVNTTIFFTEAGKGEHRSAYGRNTINQQSGIAKDDRLSEEFQVRTRFSASLSAKGFSGSLLSSVLIFA